MGQNDPRDVTKPASQPASRKAEIDAFLNQARALGPRSDGGRGRLVFALDATMSRQPAWDMACKLQAEMFEEAAAAGGLTFSSSITGGLPSAGPRSGFPIPSGSRV
jgi:hypothetical protein